MHASTASAIRARGSAGFDPDPDYAAGIIRPLPNEENARMLPPFVNEPYVDFSQDGPRRKMLDALKRVESEIFREYPLVIGGERIKSGQTIESRNPARPDQVIGIAHRGTEERANQAVRAAAPP